MQKYQITVGGKHTAALEIGEGQSFTGSIESDEFGKGTVSGSRDGDTLSGSAYIDNHHASFSATVSGNSIAGSLTAFFFREEFSGARTDLPAETGAQDEDAEDEQAPGNA